MRYQLSTQKALTIKTYYAFYAAMERITSIWPQLSDLAADLQKPYTTVQSWVQRRSIPARYDLKLIEAAKKRGAVLTLQQLAEMRSANTPAEAAE